MSFSTLFLIIKAIFPFIKDHLIGDKGVRDLLAMNKPATVLSVCLLVMLALVVYSSHVANDAVLDRDKTRNEGGLMTKQIEILEDRIKNAESDYKRSLAVMQQERDYLKDDYADLSESYNKLKNRCTPVEKPPAAEVKPAPSQPAKSPTPPVKAPQPRRPEPDASSTVLDKLKNLHY